jgi:hypothetical protein
MAAGIVWQRLWSLLLRAVSTLLLIGLHVGESLIALFATGEPAREAGPRVDSSSVARLQLRLTVHQLILRH